MPELPEVEVCCRELSSQLVGQTFVNAVVRRRDLRLPVPTGLNALLHGKRILSVSRRGKWMVFSLSDNGFLLIHFGMTGRLLNLPVGIPPEKHSHVDMFLDSGHMLRYEDHRRFGAVVFEQADSMEGLQALSKLGIEPFSHDFSGTRMKDLLSKKKAPIKPSLMDGSLLVGVGNIYASEVLFATGISPVRPCSKISDEEWDLLAATIRSILQESISLGGTSFRDYVHSDGTKGGFAARCRVFGRDGEPCPSCSGKVSRIVQSGRSTFFCPTCQK